MQGHPKGCAPRGVSKIKGYADGGRVYSDSKTTQENLSYPSTAASRTFRSQPYLAEKTGGYAEVPGTLDNNTYPADSDYVKGRISTIRKRM